MQFNNMDFHTTIEYGKLNVHWKWHLRWWRRLWSVCDFGWLKAKICVFQPKENAKNEQNEMKKWLKSIEMAKE